MKKLISFTDGEPERVIVHKTPDGRTFGSIAAATEHQIKKAIESALEEAGQRSYHDNDYEAIVDWIWRNRREFIKAIHAADRVFAEVLRDSPPEAVDVDELEWDED